MADALAYLAHQRVSIGSSRAEAGETLYLPLDALEDDRVVVLAAAGVLERTPHLDTWEVPS